MTSKTTDKLSPEVRTRAVRMVLDLSGEHPSRRGGEIGCGKDRRHTANAS